MTSVSQRLALDAQQLAQLDAQLAREGVDAHAPQAITPRADRTSAPLSFAQQRLWFLHRLDPASAAYNVPLVLPFGALSVAALERALGEIVCRHEVLRTRFELGDDGQPVQRIEASQPMALPVVDLGATPAAQRHDAARRLAADEAARPFDLARGPLLRACVLRLAAGEHLLLLTLHHIVTDAWSMDLLAREMGVLYADAAAHRRFSLPALPIQYADYAAWQRQRLRGELLRSQLDYWRARLADAPVLELPTDRPRPPVATQRGGAVRATLPASLAEALRSAARAEQVTLFMLLLAVFKVLLHRYSGQGDVVVGSPIAGRMQAQLEPLIGFFINSLVLRTDLGGNPTWRQALQRVRDVALGAFAHQELPFEKLVEELAPQRDLSRNPLFQVMFQLLHAAGHVDASPDGGTAAFAPAEIAAKFDLSFTVQDRGGALDLFVEYNADLYDADTVEQLCAHFAHLAQACVADLGQHIGAAPMLSAAETQGLLDSCNATAADYPAEHRLHRLIARAAAQHARAVAVESEDGTLRYAELEARANRLAQRLRKLGVGPERVAGVHLERSIDMVVAIVAILKAGGAYLPLDPDQPPERLRYMIDDAQAAVVVSRGALADALAGSSARLLDLDAQAAAIDAESAEAPVVAVEPEQLAYVIYTSGSTGRPKGVMIEHRAIGNHMHWIVAHHGLNARDAVLQKTPIGFDASVWEIFAPLVTGGRLVLARQGGHRDGAYLARMVAERAVTVLQLVPSQLRLLLDEPALARCDALRLVFCGGEPLTAELCVQLRQRLPAAALHNLYGPTEATIDATSWPCHTVGAGDAVPIGVPIGNMRAHVLDAYGNLVPRGVPGLLYLGGVGLARGYLGRSALTAERFVPDPHAALPGARLYATGDRVRRRRDGALEYLGRVDQQVKLRGYRIEPGEVARVLESHAGVRQAVACVQTGRDAQPLLCAYVVAATAPPASTEDLRAHLRRYLPDYMMPGSIAMLTAIPITTHGKIDWQALPAPEALAPVAAAPQAPPPSAAARTPAPPAGDAALPLQQRMAALPLQQRLAALPLQQRLAALWAQVLQLTDVPPDASFFDLGGHSLRMVEVQQRLRTDLGLEVALLDLFRYPTLRLLAAHLAAREDASPKRGAAVGAGGPAARVAATAPAAGEAAPRRPSMQSRPVFRRPPS